MRLRFRSIRTALAPRAAAALLALATPLATPPALRAQELASTPAAAFLDSLVAEGVRANLALVQRRLVVERADAAVRQARGAYLPSLALDARYARRHGAVLDLGQLVNPAYDALNRVLGTPAFPTDLDLRLPLAQETRLRLLQPIFSPAIVAGTRIARSQRDAEAAQLASAARGLAAEIRVAYLRYAGATRVVELYDGTLPLVAENLRVNERLVSNGRATPDAVLRARAERAEVEQQLAAADERAAAARRYVNFLLDRPLDDSLAVLADSSLVMAFLPTLATSLASASARREELRQVSAGVDAARAQGRLATAAFLPSVGAAIDYGVQGNRYRFRRDADFAVATLQLQWNLFNGGQDVARRQQARLDEQRLLVQRRELERQIALEVRQAHEGAEVARRAVTTADARLAAADRAFQLVARRYTEGMSPLVEFLDARTAYTTAGLNRILSVYDALQRQVELARAAALDDVPLTPASR